MALTAVSLFSCSLLRGNMRKHTHETGAKYPQNERNTRETSANPNYVIIGLLQEARVHETSVFWERALLGSLGENSIRPPEGWLGGVLSGELPAAEASMRSHARCTEC